MKLFLASSFDKVSDLFFKKLNREPGELRVLFIANASDHYESAWWVDLDRRAFERHGCAIENIDLRVLDASQLQAKIAAADIFHVCGGSVLYLLGLLQRKKMIEVIHDSVQSGKILYTGTSAGSMIVAPDLTLSKFDEEERKFVSGVSDYTGLNLVPVYIIPHCQNAESVPSTKAILDHLPENTMPIVLLNDNHAVWVEDGKMEIVSKC